MLTAGKVLLGYFADDRPQKLVIISILAIFPRPNSSEVKQFNSATPEAEITYVMSSGNHQAATKGYPLRNQRSASRDCKANRLRPPPEGNKRL